jgi:ATP-dependent Clp protease ATP-binding subunit ClpC
MTSNAGVREISRESRLGFGAGSGLLSQNEIEAQATSELKRLFPPEFLNRVDDVVVFHPLSVTQIEDILEIELTDLSGRLAEQNYSINIQPEARDFLIEKGWDPKFGGRPLRRTLQKELEDPLARLLMEHDWPKGTVFTANLCDGKIELTGNIPYSEELEMYNEQLVMSSEQ